MTPAAETARGVLIGENAGAVSVVLAGDATLNFDHGGRLIGVYEGGYFNARGHDGRWVEKKWVDGGGGRPRRHLRPLAKEEGHAVEARAAGRVEGVFKDWFGWAASGKVSFFRGGRSVPPESAAVEGILSRLRRRLAPEALRADENDFAAAVGRVAILPPDQYLSLVIPVVRGCPWNRCTFCDFYAGARGGVLSPAQSMAAAEEAARYFGEGLSRRCSLFLGDADALAAPPGVFLDVMERAALRFPRLAAPQRDGVGGFYSFAQAGSAAGHSDQVLEWFRRSGLRRVYVGVETGSDPLRRWLRKPGTIEEVRRAVERLKAAGLSVGVILLAGVGGSAWRAQHEQETLRFLSEAPLGSGDIVYVSPLRDPAEKYGREAAAAGVTPLDGHALDAQTDLFLKAAKNRTDPPRAALYDVDEFVY